MLIDIAIAENRPDEVLRWYDKIAADPSSLMYRWSGYSDRVAAAVSESHPERAIGIYLKPVANHLKDASISNYQSAVSYLQRLKPLFKATDREFDWKKLIEDIRLKYRNRPRLIELLDKLEDRPILKAPKPRRPPGGGNAA